MDVSFNTASGKTMHATATSERRVVIGLKSRFGRKSAFLPSFVKNSHVQPF